MKQKIAVNSPPPQLLYSPEEVAAAISFHPESIRRAVRSGRIAAVKLGPLWRITAATLQRIATEGLPRL
jgi:excisionase family DNA binding protein